MLDLNQPPAEMNYGSGYEHHTVNMNAGASSSQQHPYQDYQQNSNYNPDQQDTLDLQNNAFQNFEFALQIDGVPNINIGDNYPPRALPIPNQNGHIFARSDRYRACRGCKDKTGVRRETITGCAACGKNMCGECFRDKHELDYVPTIATKQRRNIDPTERPGLAVKDHKFIIYNEDKKRNNCQHCYRKHQTRDESRRKTTLVKTKCRDCGFFMCSPCFQFKHGLDSPPILFTLEEPNTVPDQHCIYCRHNLGNNEDDLLEHTKFCDEMRKHKLGKYGCYACEQVRKSELTMRSHIREHTKYNPYKCNICHLNFKNPLNLGLHMRSHSHINYQ